MDNKIDEIISDFENARKKFLSELDILRQKYSIPKDGVTILLNPLHEIGYAFDVEHFRLHVMDRTMSKEKNDE